MSEVLLEARNLSKNFPAARRQTVHAVSDVSLVLHEGETLGLVGESGCGKSTLGRMLLHLIRPTSGEVLFRGTPTAGLSDADFMKYRRKLQMVFQDPYASLNPRMDVRDLIAEPLETYRVHATREETTRHVLELMETVGLPGAYLHRYPHQFSGGQRQRIAIARAIAPDPELIVCDEPVSALDVSIQNQILNLLKKLQQSRGLAYLFISHDLSVIRYISDRIAVMYLGKICETGSTEDVFRTPLHPYTRFLTASVPLPDPHRREDPLPILSDEIPGPLKPPAGCPFHTHCPYAAERCAREEPKLRDAGGRQTACHLEL